MNIYAEDHGSKKDQLIMGIILISAGVLLITFKKESFEWALKLFGIFLSIYGILTIYNGIISNLNISIVIGTIYSFLGLTFIVFSGLLTGIFIILAALMLIVSITQVLDHILKTITSNEISLYYIVIATTVSVIVMLYMLFNINVITDVIMVITGIILFIVGFTDVYNTIR